MRRSGSEPVQARSPLRLRLTLALLGVVWGAGAAVGFAVNNYPAWAGVAAAVSLIALVDALIVVRRIRQGSRYQPGRSVPPFPPEERERPRQIHHHRRKTTYGHR